jgi:alkyl hydroperoxide reductase subunit F
LPGFFAAGDVSNVPEKQIVVAAGEGAKAALQADRYLRRLPK